MIMSRKGIDYKRTFKKQDDTIVGDVIDEVTAVASLLTCR